MSKQFEQFKILYNQILKASLEIKNLITEENFDSIVFKEKHKSQLISKCAFLKKQIQFTEEEEEIIEEIKQKILVQEDENLNKLSNLRVDILSEIKRITAQEKIVNKYEQSEPESGTICDYTSD